MNHADAQKLGARCDLCPLRKEGIIVPPQTSKTNKLIIVGESPSKSEEKTGVPFGGASGILLSNELRKNGVAKEDAHVTNAALCRGETDKLNARAAECCAPRLLRELSELPPSAPILALGKSASKSILNKGAILKARGFIFTTPEIDEKKIREAGRKAAKSKGNPEPLLKLETLQGRASIAGRTVVPAFHPSFILRADTWYPTFRIDVERVLKLLRGELVRPFQNEGAFRVGGLEVLSELGATVSADIETDGILPLECNLLCIGISDGANTVVIWPWKSQYAKPLSRWLGSRERVVFHNGHNFDLLVLRNHGVVW